MRLSRMMKWANQDGKNWLMRLFYYTYIPIILFLGNWKWNVGYRSMNIAALFPQLGQKWWMSNNTYAINNFMNSSNK
jgi:hypothetical protein